MSNLHHVIETITKRMVTEILEAIRSSTIQELLEEPPQTIAAPIRPITSPPPAYRSPSIITVEKIVEVLSKFGGELRAEHLRAELYADKKSTARAVHEALAKGLIEKSGEKRATVYALPHEHTITDPDRVLAAAKSAIAEGRVIRRNGHSSPRS